MPTILVIDDENEMRKCLKQMLVRDGHTVLLAEDGKKGIRKLQSNKIDIVITDIFMPNKEGLETIREIKSDYHGINIVAISGGGQIGLKNCFDWAIQFGADKTLAKPFSNQELLRTINEFVIPA